jgi:hypothetical protein
MTEQPLEFAQRLCAQTEARFALALVARVGLVFRLQYPAGESYVIWEGAVHVVPSKKGIEHSA